MLPARRRPCPCFPRRPSHWALAMVLLVGPVHGAVAQPTTPQEYETLVNAALNAYEQGRWAQARRDFKRAHSMMPTARTLRTIGMSAYNLGDYVDALVHLSAALHDPRKPLTPDQQAEAQALIGQCEAQVGRFRPVLQPQSAELRVDGEVPASLRDGTLVLEPGQHLVQGRAEGHADATRALTVVAGDQAELQLQLQPEAPPAAAPTPSAAPAAASAAEPASDVGSPRPGGAPSAAVGPRDDSPLPTLGLISLGVGAAGLLASGVTALMALDRASDLEDQCSDNRCGPMAHDRLESYDRLKLMSTVAFGVGVAGAAVGALLLVSAPSEDPSRVSLDVSPFGFRLRGSL